MYQNSIELYGFLFLYRKGLFYGSIFSVTISPLITGGEFLPNVIGVDKYDTSIVNTCIVNYSLVFLLFRKKGNRKV